MTIHRTFKSFTLITLVFAFLASSLAFAPAAVAAVPSDEPSTWEATLDVASLEEQLSGVDFIEVSPAGGVGGRGTAPAGSRSGDYYSVAPSEVPYVAIKYLPNWGDTCQVQHPDPVPAYAIDKREICLDGDWDVIRNPGYQAHVEAERAERAVDGLAPLTNEAGCPLWTDHLDDYRDFYGDHPARLYDAYAPHDCDLLATVVVPGIPDTDNYGFSMPTNGGHYPPFLDSPDGVPNCHFQPFDEFDLYEYNAGIGAYSRGSQCPHRPGERSFWYAAKGFVQRIEEIPAGCRGGRFRFASERLFAGVSSAGSKWQIPSSIPLCHEYFDYFSVVQTDGEGTPTLFRPGVHIISSPSEPYGVYCKGIGYHVDACGTSILRPLDTDDDGLLDYYERFIFGTDPDNADTDGDGFSDGDEVLVRDTNPNRFTPTWEDVEPLLTVVNTVTDSGNNTGGNSGNNTGNSVYSGDGIPVLFDGPELPDGTLIYAVPGTYDGPGATRPSGPSDVGPVEAVTVIEVDENDSTKVTLSIVVDDELVDIDDIEGLTAPVAVIVRCNGIDLGDGLCVSVNGSVLISVTAAELTVCGGPGFEQSLYVGAGLCVTVDGVEYIVVNVPSTVITHCTTGPQAGNKRCFTVSSVHTPFTVTSDSIDVAVVMTCKIALDLFDDHRQGLDFLACVSVEDVVMVTCQIVLDFALGDGTYSACEPSQVTNPAVPADADAIPANPVGGTPVGPGEDSGSNLPWILAAGAALGLLLFFAWKRSKKCIHCGEKVKTVEGAVVDSEGNTVCVESPVDVHEIKAATEEN